MANGPTAPSNRGLGSSRLRRWARVTGWNARLLVAGGALVFAAAEAYLRLTQPFNTSHSPMRWVSGIGSLRTPNTHTRHTNGLDYWVRARTNSLGFLDREPLPPERTGASCPIGMIGDSMFVAHQVPIDQKFHVLLESLAAESLPQLEVTTSAFGKGGTGQVRQLALYDEYLRRLRPKLVVLGFTRNDFWDNSDRLRAKLGRIHPIRGHAFARRREDGSVHLVPLPDSPPDDRWRRADRANVGVSRVVLRNSHFAHWLNRKRRVLTGGAASRRGGPWQTMTTTEMIDVFSRRHLPPAFEEALVFTRFAFAQFAERARLDGVRLVVLANYRAGTHGDPYFDHLERITAGLGIEIASLHDHIVTVGSRPSDARFPHDAHWGPIGHRWAVARQIG